MPSQTRVVNRRREAFDVYIGRGSEWGTIYSHRPTAHPGVIRVATREEAIERYRHWLWQQICAGQITLEQLAALRGRRLGCT